MPPPIALIAIGLLLLLLAAIFWNATRARKVFHPGFFVHVTGATVFGLVSFSFFTNGVFVLGIVFAACTLPHVGLAIREARRQLP